MKKKVRPQVRQPKLHAEFLRRAARTGLFASFISASFSQNPFAQGAYELPVVPPPASSCPTGSCAGGGGPQPPRKVHLATGELQRSWTDLRFKGRGMDFSWVRTYRSKAGTLGHMGVGWDHSYNISYATSGEGISVSDGNGRLNLLTEQADGSYGSDDLNWKGEFADDGNFKITFPSLLVWNFEPSASNRNAGRIASIVDRNGNQISFEYGNNDMLSDVVDTLGRRFTITYDESGLLIGLEGPTGRMITYQYSQPAGSKGADLVASTSPSIEGTPLGNDFPEGLTTEYAYDSGASTEELKHNLTSITDATGTTTFTFSYSTESDATSPDYDRLTEIAKAELPGGYQLYLAPSGQASGALAPPVTTVITNDSIGNVIEYDYDSLNRLIAQREYTGRANPNLPTTLTSNRPTGQLRPGDPVFFQTTWAWNSKSLVTLKTNPNGDRIRKVYEIDLNPSANPLAWGNLREEWSEAGSHTPAGDQASIVEKFEYTSLFGSCCGSEFVTKMTDADGLVTLYSYDSAGNRVQMVAPDGATTDYTYDSYGRLTSTTHPVGPNGNRRVDTISYYATGGGAGRIQDQIIDANGLALKTTRKYDSWGNVIEEVNPRGFSVFTTFNAAGLPVQELSATLYRLDGSAYRVTRDIIYDRALRPVQFLSDNLDEAGLAKVPARLSTTFQYNGSGLLTRYSNDLGNGQIASQDYAYDGESNVILIRKGEAVAGNQVNNEIGYEYDERNLLFRQILAPSSSSPSTTQYDYDGNRNTVTVSTGIESVARVTKTVFDAHERPVTITDPAGGVRSFNYDARGNQTHTVFVGDPQDPVASSQDERLEESWMTFDSHNRITEMKKAHFAADQTSIGDGFRTTQWAFSANGYWLSETYDDGGVTTFSYDSADRINLTVLPTGDSKQYTYDATGNIVTITETETDEVTGNVITFVTKQTFDSHDRLTSTTDNAGQTKSYGYDSVSNLVLETDGRLNTTRHFFDPIRREVSTQITMTDTGDGSGTPVSTTVISSTWDLSNRLVSRTDGEGNVTRLAYDDQDRLIMRLKDDGSLDQFGQGGSWSLSSPSPDLTGFTSGYNAHGDPTTLQFATGTLVSTVHDTLGRPFSRTITPGAGVSGQTSFEFTLFDGLSRIVYTANDGSTGQFAYDSLSNLTLDSINGLPNTAIYDGMSQRVALNLVSGRAIQKSYSTAGRLRSVSSGGSLLASYLYVGPRRLSRRDYGNGTWTLDSYDGARRLSQTSSQKLVLGVPAIFDEQAYQWDAANNKTLWADTLGNGPVRNMAYDSANQLVASFDGVSGTTTGLVLDLAGNRLKQTGTNSGAYTLDPTLPIPADKQVNQYTSTPLDRRTYNASGSTVTIASANRVLNLTYDFRERLVSVADAAGSYSESYSYDVLGRRFKKDVSSNGSIATTLYAYMGQRIVVEATTVGGALTEVIEYAFGAMLEEAVCLWSNGSQAYYHTDDLYDVTCLTDSSGNVVERYQYGLFGAPTITDPNGTVLSQSKVGNTSMFQGLRYDRGTGLYQNRMRYYDPSIGRFITTDPKGAFFDQRALGNAATRSGNNPWSYTDPSGFQSRQPSDLEPDLNGPALGMEGLGVAVSVAGFFAGGPFTMALGLSIAIHGFVIHVIQYLSDLKWCAVEVTKSGKGGPKVGDKFCYPCPPKGKGKCPKKLKLIEWSTKDGRRLNITVEFKAVNDVCTDDCGYMVLDIYPVVVNRVSAPGGKGSGKGKTTKPKTGGETGGKNPGGSKGTTDTPGAGTDKKKDSSTGTRKPNEGGKGKKK